MMVPLSGVEPAISHGFAPKHEVFPDSSRWQPRPKIGGRGRDSVAHRDEGSRDPAPRIEPDVGGGDGLYRNHGFHNLARTLQDEPGLAGDFSVQLG